MIVKHLLPGGDLSRLVRERDNRLATARKMAWSKRVRTTAPSRRKRVSKFKAFSSEPDFHGSHEVTDDLFHRARRERNRGSMCCYSDGLKKVSFPIHGDYMALLDKGPGNFELVIVHMLS